MKEKMMKKETMKKPMKKDGMKAAMKKDGMMKDKMGKKDCK